MYPESSLYKGHALAKAGLNLNVSGIRVDYKSGYDLGN